MADTPFIVGYKAILADAARFRCLPLGGMDSVDGFGRPAWHLAQTVADFDKQSLAVRAERVAKSQLGVKESPPDSNSGPMVDQYIASCGLKPPEPWCACFQTWVLKHALYTGELPPDPASCPSWEEWAKSKHLWLSPSLTAPSDLLLYNFDGGTTAEHIGRCIGLHGSDRIAIEGNTSPTSDANGGEVAIQIRPMAVILGGVRLA